MRSSLCLQGRVYEGARALRALRARKGVWRWLCVQSREAGPRVRSAARGGPGGPEGCVGGAHGPGSPAPPSGGTREVLWPSAGRLFPPLPWPRPFP